ncbi:hypothetical protein K1719_024038 [Acacia pycnantha]|nr:hypothetical protein K1719_024038 [Acacia pycnantha]
MLSRCKCNAASRFLKLCVEAGNVEACYTLRLIRFYCLENQRSGASLYAKAAINPHVPTWYNLAVIQFNGRRPSKVHGAFAGFSGITVGICNTHYAYLPIPEVISHPKLVDPNSRMWHRCLTLTGQPDFFDDL